MTVFLHVIRARLRHVVKYKYLQAVYKMLYDYPIAYLEKTYQSRAGNEVAD